MDFTVKYESFESVCFDIIGSTTLRFLVIYRPPGPGPESSATMSDICNFIDACCNINKTTVIVGDMNFAKIDVNILFIRIVTKRFF